jgi:hypothetical protein
VIPLYAHEALRAKAKAFINRAFDAAERSSFEEAALWAALSLELLAKSALSKVNPLLIADPNDEGKSLLIAAGISSDLAGFKTIPAKAAFSRCQRSFPPFNAAEAGRIAMERNEEMHSGSLPFAGVHQEQWWSRFWGQAVLLLNAQDESLDDFVGGDRVGEVERYLAVNTKTLELRVQSMIERATQRLALVEGGMLSSTVTADLSRRTLIIGPEYTGGATCPACGDTGGLLGDYVADSDTQYDHENYVAWEVLTVNSDFFVCDHCGLLLEGPDFIRVADLPETFEVEREMEVEYDDYGND